MLLTPWKWQLGFGLFCIFCPPSVPTARVKQLLSLSFLVSVAGDDVCPDAGPAAKALAPALSGAVDAR